jgi:catechol 2,3-dioxygenase-like lactoylglutathione lyase family enzyme
MARASISHIALTVSDLDRSTEFYGKIFRFMGSMRDEVPESIHMTGEGIYSVGQYVLQHL